MKKTLDIFLPCAIIQKLSDGTRQRTEYGGIAQLGERLNGIQEVSGSIPLISTTSPENHWFSGLFLLHFGGFSVFSAFPRTGAIHPGSRYFSYQNCTRIRLVPMRPMCLDGTCPGGLKTRRKICRLLPAGWALERGGNGQSYPHRRVPRCSEW